jgi:DNA polymerase V
MIVPLRRPSDDTAAIVGAAVAGLKAIYQPGYRLAKAGVMLLDIQPASRVQCEFNFETTSGQCDCGRLMQAMDSVNRRWGQGAIRVGSARVGEAPRDRGMKQERKTPGYTTEWDEMLVVKA